jgi:hypothetical protein
MKLYVVPNCDSLERFEKWKNACKNEGLAQYRHPKTKELLQLGFVNNEYELGCAINSLTFLEIFTRQKGKNMVKNLTEKTSFDQIIKYVSKHNLSKKYTEFTLPLNSAYDVTIFLNLLTSLLELSGSGSNNCTVVKLNRLIGGHTVIYSIENHILYFIDPMIGQIKPRLPNTDDKIFNAWKNNPGGAYISASIMLESLKRKRRSNSSIKRRGSRK